jgi:hypothetical protein
MSRQNPNKKVRLFKIVFDFNRLPSKRLIGTRFAFTIIRLGYLCSLCCFLMSGCLVTDEIKFGDEPNVPPVLIDSPERKTPIGDIIYFNYFSSSVAPEDASAYTPPSIVFSLRVRDENIGQPLYARRNLFEQNPNSGQFISKKDNIVDVPIVQSMEKFRDIDFTIDVGFFEKPELCYRVELAVTSGFKTSVPNANNWALPETDDDIAIAQWYVVRGETTKCQWTTEYQ